MTNYLTYYRGIPSSCWYFIVLNVINAVAVGLCFFLSIYFVDSLKFSMTTVGFLMSCYGLGTVMGGLLAGKCCDVFSPRLILILSILIEACSFLMLGHLNAIVPLAINLLILGIFAYGFKTSNHVLLLQHCKDNTGAQLKAINITYAASNLGLGISGVGISVLSAFGYQFIFNGAGVLLLGSFLFVSLMSNMVVIAKSANEEKEGGSNFFNPSSKIVWLALVSLFCVGVIIAQLGSTYPIYVKEAFPTLGIQAVSILFVLDTVLIVLFQAPLSNYFARYNAIIVMGLGAACMGIGMFILIFTAHFSYAIISCIIWTTGEMLFLPTAQLLCYRYSRHEKKGQSIGVYQSTYATSTVIGPFLGGYLYHAVSPDAMWYLALLIGVSCFGMCLLMQKQG